MGKAVRVPLASFLEPSTVQGRTLMRLDAEATQDGVVLASLSDGHEVVSLASRQGRCINFPVADINVLSGVGKGVAALKLTGEDRVLGATLCRHRDDGLTVETNRGRIDTVRPSRYAVVRRGNRGHELLRTGYIARIHTEPVVFPLPPTDTASLDRPPRRRAGPAPPQGSLL
jgi:DNA gyrase subunit A